MHVMWNRAAWTAVLLLSGSSLCFNCRLFSSAPNHILLELHTGYDVEYLFFFYPTHVIIFCTGATGSSVARKELRLQPCFVAARRIFFMLHFFLRNGVLAIKFNAHRASAPCRTTTRNAPRFLTPAPFRSGRSRIGVKERNLLVYCVFHATIVYQRTLSNVCDVQSSA